MPGVWTLRHIKRGLLEAIPQSRYPGLYKFVGPANCGRKAQAHVNVLLVLLVLSCGVDVAAGTAG